MAADVAKLWIKASLPIVSKSRIETKLFDIVNKLRAAKKRAIESQSQSLTETWLFELFDISACKCKNSANPNMQFWNGKFACSCPFEHWIPAEKIDFLKDQRESRNMILTSKVDIAHRKQQEKKIAKKRKNDQPELLKKRTGKPRKVLITSERLPTTGHNEEVELELVGDNEFCCVINKPKIQVAEIVTKTKCVLADRRCTSLRQQADQLTGTGKPRKVLITSERLPTTGHNEEVELELVGDNEFCCVLNKPKIQVAEIVTKTKCVLADRRCTSLRQQADQLTP